MKNKLQLLAVFVLILSACMAQSSTLTGTWKLIAYGSLESMIPAVADVDATLTFGEDGTVSGSGGCNSLGGEYEVNGGEITFGPITSTLMGCDEPRMAQESFVTQVLTDTAEFEIDGETLTITNEGMVLEFSATTAK